jgi:hypothetical protein
MPTGLKTFSVFWFEERMPPPRHSRLLQAAQMLQKSIVRRKQYPSNPDEPDGKVILNNSVFESDRLRISTRDVILVINNQFFGVQGSRPAQENAKLILFSLGWLHMSTRCGEFCDAFVPPCQSAIRNGSECHTRYLNAHLFSRKNNRGNRGTQ